MGDLGYKCMYQDGKYLFCDYLMNFNLEFVDVFVEKMNVLVFFLGVWVGGLMLEFFECLGLLVGIMVVSGNIDVYVIVVVV